MLVWLSNQFMSVDSAVPEASLQNSNAMRVIRGKATSTKSKRVSNMAGKNVNTLTKAQGSYDAATLLQKDFLQVRQCE
jgi:hypothetical protein